MTRAHLSFRRLSSGATLATSLLAALTAPRRATADDTNPKPPNVLLLIDDSGSMNWRIDADSNPSCGSPDASPNSSAQKSRWALLTEALTGTVNNFGCSSSGKLYSNLCSPGANSDVDTKFASGTVPAYGWPTSTASSGLPSQARDPINFPHYKKSGSSTVTDGTYCAVGPGGWDQSADGVIDTFSRQMRFGIMTFDDEFPRFGTNSSSAIIPTSIPSSGGGFYPGSGSYYYTSWAGGYSYWFSTTGNWQNQTNPHRGAYGRFPSSAGTTVDYEVGARNMNARPWEGRLMGFGSSDDPKDYAAQNDRVQLAILGLTPSTSTPLAGLLADANDYILRDSTLLSNYPTSGQSFLLGPAADPASGVCRETDVVLVTDGVPNLDMRSTADGGALNDYLSSGLTPCNQSGGSCPYEVPGYYAADLAAHGVKVHVVGLASTTVDWKAGPGNCPAKWASNPGSVGAHCIADCTSIDASDYGPSGSTGKMCAGKNSAWDHGSDPAGFGDPSQCCELADIALKGGTRPYFPANVNDIKTTFAQLLSTIAGGATSRTVPSFAVAARTIQPDANPQQPSGISPSSYEVLSSLEVQVGNAIWGGHIERRRLVCDGTSANPIVLDIDKSRGDSFDDTMAKNYGKRNFFTVVAESGGAVAVDQSLRRTDLPSSVSLAAPNSDGLGTVGVSITSNQTVLDKPDKIDTRIDARLTSKKTKDVLGIDWTTSAANCQSLLAVSGTGAAGEASCAKKALVWYGGGKNGLSSDRIPDPFACPKCNPLGAIYHSTPVTIGPPSDDVRDESYRNGFAVAQMYRPTMTYAQTLDGQLHAFVLESNAPASDLVYGSTPHTDSNSTLNELWTFVPPTVLPRVWPNFNASARMLDGGLVVADVVPLRTNAQAQSGSATWKTYLVGASGEAASGGFYYALDVTNPLVPEFLWQLRTDGAGNALFGKSVPTAAVATLAIADPLDSSKTNQVAVAILAGGAAPGATPTTTRARRCGCAGSACAPCSSSARSTIRDWGDTVTARSVTIVELSSGRILKRFVGDASATGDAPAMSARVAAGFDSPMTGTPIAFPNAPGIAASRAYVGDADGTLWRLDLSNRDPAQWRASIAADVYKTKYAATGSMPVAALAGQPIENAPILSTNPLGNPVVIYSTGAQEAFSTLTPGTRNYLVSMVDQPSGAGTFVGQSAVVVEMKDGERATGPMALFNSDIYFSSYVPDASSVCSVGFPRVWGIDYLTDTAASTPAGSGANDPSNGLDTNNDGVADKRFVALDTGSVVFGVGINRVPSCVSSVQSFGDQWLAGTYGAGLARAGKYELVIQTGKGSSAAPLGGEDLLSAGGNGQQGALTKSMHVDLPSPKQTARVDSWTFVME